MFYLVNKFSRYYVFETWKPENLIGDKVVNTKNARIFNDIFAIYFQTTGIRIHTQTAANKTGLFGVMLLSHKNYKLAASSCLSYTKFDVLIHRNFYKQEKLYQKNPLIRNLPKNRFSSIIISAVD